MADTNAKLIKDKWNNIKNNIDQLEFKDKVENVIVNPRKRQTTKKEEIIPVEPKVPWNERKKEYFKNYFQEKVKKNKDVVIEKKNIDWNNIEEKRKYYNDYYHKNRQKFIKEHRMCEVCMCLITDKYHHNKTKKHQQAVFLTERLTKVE